MALNVLLIFLIISSSFFSSFRPTVSMIGKRVGVDWVVREENLEIESVIGNRQSRLAKI